MSELNVDSYYIRAILVAAATSPRCARPSREDLDAFVQGAAYGLEHGLNYAAELIGAAEVIATLTNARDVQAFLMQALRSTLPNEFPLKPIFFDDEDVAGGEGSS